MRKATSLRLVVVFHPDLLTLTAQMSPRTPPAKRFPSTDCRS